MPNVSNFARPIREEYYLGYNDNNPSESLQNGVFTKADNAYVSDYEIVKVEGSTAIAPAIAAKNINGIEAYEKISASVKYIIVSIDGASNAQLYQWNGSGNFSAIGSANLTNSTPVYFETANDYLFGFNGVEVVDYDGTTVTVNRSGVPKGYYPSWFHNYLFVAKTNSLPNRLFWSNLGDPTTFTNTNFVDVNPGDSDQIMGLGQMQDELFVFKQETIWSITGWSGTSFSSTTIATQNTNARLIGYGCIATNSIISTGNDIYFLSFLGSSPVIRSLRKTQLAQTLGGGVISNDIKVTMNLITKSSLGQVEGIFDGRYARWTFPQNGGINNKIIVLDTWGITKIKGRTFYPWTTMTGKNAGHFTLSTISGTQLVYFSDSNPTGKVFKFDSTVSTDNGNAITMDVRTRDFMLDPARKSKWKYLYLKYQTGSSGTLQINARVDQAANFGNQLNLSLQGNSPGLGPTGMFTLGVSQLGGSTTSEARVILKQLTGYLLGVQFLESTSNPCTIYEYSIFARPKGLRKA